ncbi:MAG: mechanosensitive ion channel domain-containing protein, partial [Desulfobacterales bacterium]
WKKRFIYGLAVVSIVTRVLEVLGFPTPLFRLYTVLTASIGLLFCLRWAKESTHLEESRLYTWSLRVAALFFSFIILAECGGQGALASHLFIFFIRLVGSILASIMFMYMIRGVLEWLFKKSPLKRTPIFSIDDNEPIINRLARFIDVAFVGLVLLPATLMFWGAYDSLSDATKALLSIGFTLGTLRIDVGLLLAATGLLYITFITSWIIQKLLLDDLIFKGRFDKGVRFSIGRLVHYALILFGFMFALSALGFELSKITIMLSALGVGIGFGLQGIANNFFSGLILLFERPVRVGDVIQITGEWAEIKKIGIRATTVQTFDRADRIIPNNKLISDEVINWTLTNRQVRLIVPVGVAYGSDIDLVTDMLMACAQTNPKVATKPEPRVMFLNFGESSLDFELRVYVADFDHRIEVRSKLHYQIVRSFRAANIEIPFPQRDLHFRNGSESDVSQPTEVDG